MKSTGSAASDSQEWRRFLLAGLILAAILYLLAVTPIIGENYDDAHYITLAQSLAQGDGYRLLSRPDAPPGVKYPPGWPMLLTPVWWLASRFPANAVLFKWVSALCSLGLGLVTAGWLTWRGHSKRTAVLIALLTLFNPLAFGFATSAFSEMAYAFFALSGIWLAEWFGRQSNATWRTAVPVALIAAFLIYLRIFGVALAVGLCLYLVLNRKWRHLVWFLSLLVLFVIPWGARQIAVAGETPSYVREFWLKSIEQPELGRVGAGEMLLRVILNLRAYLLAALPGVLFPSQVQTTFVNMPASLHLGAPLFALETLLALLVGASVAGQILLRRQVGDWYLAVYLGVALLWPWEPVRFTIPLIPLLYEALFFQGGMFWTALKEKRPSLHSRLDKLVLGAWLLFLAANMLLLSRFAWQSRQTAVSAPEWQAKTRLFEWIRQNTEPADRLAGLPDFQLYLYTGRTAVRQFDPGFLRENKVDYVVLIPYGGVLLEGDLSRIRFGPTQSAAPAAFNRVYFDEPAGIEVFQVNIEKLPQ